MIFKEVDNHVAGDEQSFEAFVTKNKNKKKKEKQKKENPYYPYNQEWFGHDEEDTPNLVED